MRVGTASALCVAFAIAASAQVQIKQDGRGHVVMKAPEAAPKTPAAPEPVIVPLTAPPYGTDDGDDHTANISMGEIAPSLALYKAATGGGVFAVRDAGNTGSHRRGFPYHGVAAVELPQPVAITAGRGVAEGIERRSEVLNIYSGAQPSEWKTSIPVFRDVRFTGASHGVDVVQSIHPSDNYYQINVAPLTEVHDITVQWPANVHEDNDGNLVVPVSGSAAQLHIAAPHAWQSNGGFESQVGSRWRANGTRVATIQVGAYDLSRSVYVAFEAPRWAQGPAASGSAFTMKGAIATDASRAIYIADGAVIAKFAPNGDPVYSTILGTPAKDGAIAIAADAAGNLFVAMAAMSSDQPLKKASDCAAPCEGVLIAKLGTRGELIDSSFASGYRGVRFLSVSSDGAVYVAGNDYVAKIGGFRSSIAAPLVPTALIHDADGNVLLGVQNGTAGRVMKIGPKSVLASADTTTPPRALAVDGAKNIYVAGSDGHDGFAEKFNATLDSVRWNMPLGGNGDDAAYAIAVDKNQTVYVAGETSSPEFNVEGGPSDAHLVDAGTHLFAVRIASTGLHTNWSLILGTGAVMPGNAMLAIAGNALVMPVEPSFHDDGLPYFNSGSVKTPATFLRVANCVSCVRAPTLDNINADNSSLDIGGHYFNRDSRVLVNGKALETVEYLAESSLRSAIAAKDGETLEVSVVNADQQSATYDVVVKSAPVAAAKAAPPATAAKQPHVPFLALALIAFVVLLVVVSAIVRK